MKCPKCKHVIYENTSFCRYCGCKYSDEFQSNLNSYMELKAELNNLRSITKKGIEAGIERLSLKIEKYYGGDIGQTVLTKPEPETPAGVPPPYVQAAQESQDNLGNALEKEPPIPADVPVDKEEKQHKDMRFETAMGQKWLLIIGVVATVFGIGYFLKYSFEKGWIGPAGRVAAAYVWGALFLFGGNLFRRRNMETFGLYLSGGGIATLYFATFAAFQIYHLIGQTTAFLLMVMVTSLAGLLAVMYDAKWLAVLGIIGGFLTPVLLSTGQDNHLVLMSYMTILNLGLLGVAFYKKWNLLTVLGFFFTYLLYSTWYAKHYAPEKFWPAVIFLNIFFLIYSVMPFITRFLRKEQEKGGGFAVIIPNSFIAFAFSYHMVRAHFSLEAVGVVSVLYAAVFLLMASYVFMAGKQHTEGFVVLAGKVILFLVITVPLIFSKHWITVFWSAQAIAILWMGIRLGNVSLSRSSLLLYFITAVKLFLYDYPEVFGLRGDLRISPNYGHFLLERWITAAVFLILIYSAAGMVRKHGISLSDKPGENKTHHTLYGAFGFLLFLFLNIETSAFFYENLPDARFAAISVLWTLFSVGMMIFGFSSASAALRKTALALFTLTIGKVFLFDMANVSTPYRIISFIMLGLILVGTSYLYHKYKYKLIPEDQVKQGEKV